MKHRLSRALASGECDFYELLEHAGHNAVEAAERLDELVHYFPRHGELADQLARLRNAGNGIDDELAGRLAATYVTPFDRDQLRRLSRSLRDVVARLEAVADLLAR